MRALMNLNTTIPESKLLHVVILSRSTKRIAALRATWMRGDDITIFTDKPDADFGDVRTVALHTRRRNYHPNRHMYVDETPQLQEAFRWVQQFTNALYILRVDDDAIVCMERLRRHLQTVPRTQYLMTGHQWWGHPDSWFCTLQSRCSVSHCEAQKTEERLTYVQLEFFPLGRSKLGIFAKGGTLAWDRQTSHGKAVVHRPFSL